MAPPVEIDPTIEAAKEAARNFMAEQIPDLSRLFNIGGIPTVVGKKWSTTMKPPVVMTVDPGFFVERGYKSEWSVYATLHEVAAHVRPVLWEPLAAAKAADFAKQGDAQRIFHNILSDIAGNKTIHARLPKLAETAEDLYHHKLFQDDVPPLNDPEGAHKRYEEEPRHLQFLYKIIRQEMIPGSHTSVMPEVNEAIARLRDYEGSGQDAIKYSTDLAKPDGTPMKYQEQLGLWLTVIYPEFEQLLEQDKQDPNFASKQSSNQGNRDGQPADGSGDSSESQPGNEPQDGQPQSGDDDGQFKESYDDYYENKHPEPMDEGQEEAVKKIGEQIAHQQPNSWKRYQARNAAIRKETGHSLQEQQSYNRELLDHLDQINAMRDLFFKHVIEPSVAIKRRLGRTPQTEGAILDPNRLVDTIIEISNGNEEPKAFVDYERRRAPAQAVGNTDYYLVLDRSDSMRDENRAVRAATSTLIFLEGLAALQKDIEEAEEEYGIDLDASIRSAVYGFGNAAHRLKELSSTLDTKERLDCYTAARQPLKEGTADYLALQAIDAEPRDDPERRRIIVVLSDGESDDSAEAGTIIAKLRSSPNTSVYGISIGSDEAVTLYAPDARRCDNPDELPELLEQLLEETLQ